MSEGAADGGEGSRHGLRSSIVERGRVAGAIKACFASIGFCGLAAVAPALAQAPENGDELARMMIAQAETGGGRVDMHRFGDGACFVAEGLSAAYVARRQFPGYPVAYREADPGNGLWFILLADHGKANVRIYAIKQGVLRWDVPENARVGDAMVCSDTADISTSAAVGSGRSSSQCPEAADSHCRSRNRGRWAALRSAHPAAYAPAVHPVAIVHSRSPCNRSI